MPRYNFHVDSSAGVSGDVDGRDLTDDASAVREAASCASEVLMDELTSGVEIPRVVVTVERGDGTKTVTVTASAQIDIIDRI